jgi:hypothetical protein
VEEKGRKETCWPREGETGEGRLNERERRREGQQGSWECAWSLWQSILWRERGGRVGETGEGGNRNAERDEEKLVLQHPPLQIQQPLHRNQYSQSSCALVVVGRPKGRTKQNGDLPLLPRRFVFEARLLFLLRTPGLTRTPTRRQTSSDRD